MNGMGNENRSETLAKIWSRLTRRNFGTFEVFANENTNKIAFYLVIVLTSVF